VWCIQLVIESLQASVAIIWIVALCWSYIHHLFFKVHRMIVADGMPFVFTVSYIWSLFSVHNFYESVFKYFIRSVRLVLSRCCVKNATIVLEYHFFFKLCDCLAQIKWLFGYCFKICECREVKAITAQNNLLLFFVPELINLYWIVWVNEFNLFLTKQSFYLTNDRNPCLSCSSGGLLICIFLQSPFFLPHQSGTYMLVNSQLD